MFSLYVHVPFCRRKCPYCDFYSVPAESPQLAAYHGLLLHHLSLVRKEEWNGPVGTIFFGGGTPSLLPPAAIAQVIEATGQTFGLAADAEITLEANPGTVTRESLDGYRAAGVNRLSFGVQSLQDENLRRLARIHSPAEARQAVVWARQAGFDNLSCDLMFALPGQTPSHLQAEIVAFLDLGPDHLSCYGLTVEEQTPFYHLHRAGSLELPDEEVYRSLYLGLHAQLTAAGFGHYEISNYARPGFEGRHNLAYWERLPYLGLGAGAHTFCDSGWGERRAVPPDLQLFAATLARGENPIMMEETFDRRGAMAETLYLGLRTAAGVSEAKFRAHFGAGVAEAFPAAVQRLGGALRQEGDRWFFDVGGWLLYDHLITSFL